MRTRLSMTLALGASLVAPSVVAAQTIAIVGGKVYPVSAPPIENGTVLIRDGRIVAVGASVAVPAGAQRIDATGKIVTPGFVNGASHVGLEEIGSVPATREMFARGRDRIAAAFRPWEGLNPRSVLIGQTRDAGITAIAVTPASGLISGQVGILRLVNGGVTDMLLRAPVGMVANLGPTGGPNATPRAETLLRLREVLEDTRVYRTRRADYERAQTRQLVASRLDMEALVPVLEGRVPLIVSVDRASDIETAMKIAREYGIRLIVSGGAEAWMVADRLAAAKIPVLTGAMNNIPNQFATLGQRQENAALLAKAGVPVTLIGNAEGGSTDALTARNVRYEAGNAVAYGMEWNAALRAITLTPAEIFGVADQIGSLAPGKRADVVVWSGDPFEFSSRAEHVFVNGVQTTLPTREDLLESRYKTLPPAYRNP
ncbi:MAG: amidohydrolase family protein [Gemmatimonadetes bacterium]|nr:amidohydrolase family protein [Gemmatimonadota bacterium]